VRGKLHRPVQRQGWAHRQTISGWPLTTVGDGGADAVGNVEADDACPPSLVLRTAPKYNDVGRREGDNMAGGSGKIVIGGAGASYAMALMLVRRASRGAARDSHAAGTCQSATSTWAGGSAGIAARWRCCALVRDCTADIVASSAALCQCRSLAGTSSTGSAALAAAS
jgi:hypothetical protein